MKVELIDYTKDAEQKISEFAGICYDSKGANVKRLKADGHLATFRFAYATFKVSGVSRACAMQMLRHKFLEFLMRSQRYCKETDFDYVIPKTVQYDNEDAWDAFSLAMIQSEQRYNDLLNAGIKAEDARYVLPNACVTEFFVTGNFQAWYDFLYGKAGRLQKAAQWEIKTVAQDIEAELSTISPTIFGVTER